MSRVALSPIAKAIEITSPDHPYYTPFMAWLKGKQPTKRKAREFVRRMHIPQKAA